MQVVRTIAEDMYTAFPRGSFRIFESYLRLLRGAREVIYLENQFLWSPELVDVLADKLRNPPTPDFRIVLLLPAKANNGAEDTRGQLGVLVEADNGHGRVLGATIRSMAAEGGRADPLYVHAKVAVVDDRWLIVGSANLNAHSFFNDTELCVVTDDAALARDTRVRCGPSTSRCPPPRSRSAPRCRSWTRAGARCRRTAAPAAIRGAAHPPAARAARRVAPVAAVARSTAGAGRRRLRGATRGVTGWPPLPPLPGVRSADAYDLRCAPGRPQEKTRRRKPPPPSQHRLASVLRRCAAGRSPSGVSRATQR